MSASIQVAQRVALARAQERQRERVLSPAERAAYEAELLERRRRTG